MSRDTQFQGFANLLVRILRETTSQEEAELLLTHHAYDLVRHTCEAISNSQVALYPDEMIKVVPDMTELPDEYVIDKVEAFKRLASPGVTFSDEQKEMIQERLAKEQEP